MSKGQGGQKGYTVLTVKVNPARFESWRPRGREEEGQRRVRGEICMLG